MPNKKTELHIHTKMSEMRGLISPKELVEYALEHKYDIIAVTDLGSVQAFPEVYHIWKKHHREFEETNRMADEGSGSDDFLKIIYGMEAYFIENPDQALTGDSRKCHPVLLYAANEAGIRNLYRLVSYGRRDPKNGSLEIDRSLLAKYREGLLVGAVCDGGELSEAIRLKRGDKELSDRASFYDFIEITPFCESSVLYDNGEKIYRTCDNMKAMLKKLFLLGKEEQIPVIMAS
ncbi:MAG: PHP domain-containing protein, partial [Lachnospiraceae bacterium]|nr:PHP domain-containing protein [Lachnospiraceae bacterium]